MFIRRAAIAAAAIAAPLAFAAPAMAQPQDGMNFQCAPCVGGDRPIWNQIFDPNANGQGIWETGVSAVNGGVWENAFDATDGVPGDGEGAWEKVFPPAEG
jgi:hypothetical protein